MFTCIFEIVLFMKCLVDLRKWSKLTALKSRRSLSSLSPGTCIGRLFIFAPSEFSGNLQVWRRLLLEVERLTMVFLWFKNPGLELGHSACDNPLNNYQIKTFHNILWAIPPSIFEQPWVLRLTIPYRFTKLGSCSWNNHPLRYTGIPLSQ